MASGDAWQAGWNLGSGFAQEKHAHKQALSDQELQTKIGELIDNRKAIQAKLPTLLDDKGNPTPQYNDAIAELTKNAHDLRTIYHPETNPSAISKFGHLLTDMLHVTKPEDRIQKEAAKREAGTIQDERTAQGVAAAAPISPEQQASKTYSAQVNAQLDAIEKSGMSEENKERAREAVFKIYQKTSNKVYKAPDGTIYAADINDPDSFIPGSVPYTNPTVGSIKTKEYEDAVAKGFKGTIEEFEASKSGKMTSGQLLQDSYLATIGLPSGTQWNTLSDAQRSGYELYLNGLKKRFSTRQTPITDRDGNVHIVDLTSIAGPAESAPIGTSGQQPPNGNVSTPEAVKNKAAKVKSGPAKPTSKEGLVLNFKKATPDYTKAKNTYNDANRISTLADQWIQHPNSEADANFVLSLIRSEAGRVNQQEIGQMFNAGGVAEAPDRWAAKIGHGELPPDLRKQIVDFVHLQKDAAKQVLDDLGSPESGQGKSEKDPLGVL